jgi:hypothetical protein
MELRDKNVKRGKVLLRFSQIVSFALGVSAPFAEEDRSG